MKTLINFLLKPFRWIKKRQEFKRKLKELREKDPHIYTLW